jgi:hypothetical protein
MKNLLKLTVLSLVVMGLLLCGCGKESTTEPEPESDREAIRWLIEDNPSYFNTQNHYGEEDTTGGRIGTLSPIITYFWYREILKDSINIDVNIDIVGDSAFVSWFGEFDGIFHIFADTIFPPDSIIEYTKDFTDFGERNAVFKRLKPVNDDPQHRRGWRLVKVSGAEIISDGNTVQIDSVRLNSEHYPDTLLTDPLALFAKEDVVTLSPEEECSLTVYTNSDTLDHVFLHSWRKHTPHHRHPFHSIGNGVFTGVWLAPSNETGAMNVIHHVAFDMISTGTLDDDVEPYDSNAWLFPYMVTTSR